MKNIILTIATACLSVIMYGQQIMVINSGTLEPVENVAIYNRHMNKATLTNNQGLADITVFEQVDSLFFQHPSFHRWAALKIDIPSVVKLNKKVILIEEFVISASKTLEKKREIPFSMDVITPRKLTSISTQTSADLLTSTGNVLVQKSQGGGGSPIIRGFEANKVLLVVDGVRMNNAIYRNGHLQNALTIDNTMIERAEITFGPNSIIYGSDALGGVIHYYTKQPTFGTDSSVYIKANTSVEYSSANNAKVAHLDFSAGFKNIAFISGVTFKDFGDITMGRNRNPLLDTFGLFYNYIETTQGKDTMIRAKNKYLQKNTGYKQYDFTNKIKYKVNNELELSGNFQFSTSSNIPRFDQLIKYNNDGTLKYAQWDYGPQNRLLLASGVHYQPQNVLFDKLNLTVAFQDIDEERITRRVNNLTRERNLEEVSVFSVNADFIRSFRYLAQLNYGAEYRYNYVKSYGFTQHIYTKNISEITSRYPDKGSLMHDAGVYTTFKLHINNQFIFSAGTRLAYNYLSSEFDLNTEAFGIGFNNISFNNVAFTYNGSMVYLPSPDVKASVLFSKGYRNPNVDDVGKIREKNGLLLIPSQEVKPEHTYNFEAGVTKTFDGYIQIHANIYNIWLRNAIVREKAYINGADSIRYQDDMVKLIRNGNASKALIQGISAGVLSDFNSNLSFSSTINYTRGIDKQARNDEPLAHIPPVFGQTSIMYDIQKFHFKAYVNYNGWKKIEDMDTDSGEDNHEYGTQYGFPGWYTLNFFTSYNVSRSITCKFAIENVLDTFYKPYASGVSAPGRNLIFTLAYRV